MNRAARVDPKVWFSAERTFLHWAKISVVFAAAAALLLGVASASAGVVEYEGVSRGACVAPVVGKKMCTAAATGTTTHNSTIEAKDDGLKDSKKAPPFCYVEGGKVKYNAKGGNTGECSERQVCICQVVEANWVLFAPGGAVALASLVVLAHAYRRHLRRLRGMSGGRVDVRDFADKCGAYLLVVTLTMAVTGVIAAPVISNQMQDF
mmetsp:Transcript_116749/g.326602  ORF Transcript_116749/g.326602 Transcript_116749/m.326602 type:complete len:207 (+) Transcript_116749:138-758(+)